MTNLSRLRLLGGALLLLPCCATKAPLVKVDQWIPSALEDVQRGLCNQNKATNFGYAPIGATPAVASGVAGAAGGDSHVTLTVQALVGYQAGVGPVTVVPLSGQVSGSDTRTITVKLVNLDADGKGHCPTAAEKAAASARPALELFELQDNGTLVQTR